MARRTYADSCGIARALDLIGDRWSLLVVRELLLGPKRYTDLQKSLRRIAPDVLSQRLRDLEAGGLAERAELPGPGRAKVYRLTDHGRELRPVLLELGRFGSRLPLPDQPEELTPDAFALALLTVFHPAGGEAAPFGLILDGERFIAALTGGTFTIERDETAQPTSTIETSTATLTRVLWLGTPAGQAEAEGSLHIAGDRHPAEIFLQTFTRPVTR